MLERWLDEAARQTDIASGRLRRWLGFMVLAGMLDTARHPIDDTPLFVVKGGVAMELRFDVAARATKDFDTAYRDDMATITDRLDAAIASGYGEFTATRTALEQIKNTTSLRCNIKLAYKSRPVVTVQMEVASADERMGHELDLVPAKPLDHVGLTGPTTVACLPVRWQIAQKLHACTETFPDRSNDRFRDLLDLQLLGALLTDEQYPSVRLACLEVFTARAKQPWPPQVSLHPGWDTGYRTIAEETHYPIHDVDAAAIAVTALISRIDAAQADGER